MRERDADADQHGVTESLLVARRAEKTGPLPGAAQHENADDELGIDHWQHEQHKADDQQGRDRGDDSLFQHCAAST